jgi:hypothetical protein
MKGYNMIQELELWILKRKNPCRKCLVGPICNEKSLSCDSWDEHMKLRRKIDKISGKIETVWVIGVAGIAVVMVCMTFILGLYQWYQVFSVPIRKWLF